MTNTAIFMIFYSFNSNILQILRILTHVSTVHQNDAIICLWDKSYLSKLKYFALFAGFMKRAFVECVAGTIGRHCEIVCPYP